MTRWNHDEQYANMSLEAHGDHILLHAGWDDGLGEIVTPRGVRRG